MFLNTQAGWNDLFAHRVVKGSRKNLSLSRSLFYSIVYWKNFKGIFQLIHFRRRSCMHHHLYKKGIKEIKKSLYRFTLILTAKQLYFSFILPYDLAPTTFPRGPFSLFSFCFFFSWLIHSYRKFPDISQLELYRRRQVNQYTKLLDSDRSLEP